MPGGTEFEKEFEAFWRRPRREEEPLREEEAGAHDGKSGAALAFEKAFDTGVQRNRRAARDNAAEARAARKIFNEAGYAKGADPRDFLSESDVLLCDGFIELANKNGLRGSRLLMMSRLIQLDPPQPPGTYARTRRVAEGTRGYIIGSSKARSPHSTQQGMVLLCQDGLLRIDSHQNWSLDSSREVVTGNFWQDPGDAWDPESLDGNAGRRSGPSCGIIPAPLEKVLVGLAIEHGFKK